MARSLEPDVVVLDIVMPDMDGLQALASLRFTALSRTRALRLRFRWLEEGETIHGLAGKHPILLYQALFLPILLLAIAGFLLFWSFSGGTPVAV